MTERDSNLAIHARGLGKHFGDTHALRGLDLDVKAGTVLGMLGPNGAGKTTAVRILSTLIRPDEGSARVAGFDVVRDGARVRSRIGLIGQAAAVDELLTGTQNLVMFARLHGMSRAQAKRRASALLEQFDLAGAADRMAKTYSGGMRRRLDIAAGIVTDPDLLFLDEPTTGLDPVSRASVWQIVQRLTAAGTTVLLTTQYLEEADQLADDIVVIDHGTAIARGTSAELKEQIGGARVEIVTHTREQTAAAERVAQALGDAAPSVEPDERRVVASFPAGARQLPDLVRALDAAGVELDALELRQPTLDDVFMQLTGEQR